MELFNSSQFSSLDDDALRDFEVENVSSKKKAVKRTQPKLDPAWDDGSAFPEVSSKNFEIGDRIVILFPKKYAEELGHICGYHTEGSPEVWVKLDNQDLQIRVFPHEVKFLEEVKEVSAEQDSKTENLSSKNICKTGDRLESPKETKISDCWYTPPEIVALIQQCLNGITLDPCSDNGKHIESCQHLTAADDGLSQKWSGRVFMNPPYSCPGKWVCKLQEEFDCGRVEEAIALVPVATDTKWFHPLISSNLICFWKGRIKFLDVNYQPKMPARQSHALIYWGKNQSRFREIFSPVGSFNSSEENSQQRTFKVGDRFEIIAHKKYSGQKGYLSGYHTNDSPEFWVKLDNYDLQIRVFPDQVKSSEEKGVTECNLNTPAYVQESPALNSELRQPEHLTLSKQNYSLKTTPTLKQSSNTDFQTSQSTAILQTTFLNRENSISTQSVFPAPAPALQATEPDLTTQNQACGFKPCAASPTANPISPSSKILRGLSVEDFEQCLEDCEWSNIVGTIHKSFQQRNSERRTSAKGFSSLPTPTTYAKGSTGCRPAGATRLEQSLRKFITKGDKLNPGVPGWMMGFPVGWVESTLMDTGETISVQLPFIPEYATTSTNAEIATTSTPDRSAPSKLRSQLSESVTSPISSQPLKQSDVKVDLYICNSFLDVGKITEVWQTCFTVDWNGEIKCYIWERDDELIGKLALAQPAAGIAPQALIEKSSEETQLIAMSYDKACATAPAPSVTHSDAELQQLHLVESFISTQSDIKLLSTQEIIETLSISEDELDEFWNNEPALFKGFKIQWLGATIQKWRVEPNTFLKDRLPQSESIPEKFLEDKKQSPSIEPLSLSSIEGNTTPENFLEESTADTKQLPPLKRRQCKGCLYKYLENKKLKNGNIASYPRVIGETRDPDNPKHWRWGFNWEEKIDGEWKGRSIGSVAIGAIALIQSMQKSNIPLEEIISFIKRSKSKK